MNSSLGRSHLLTPVGMVTLLVLLTSGFQRTSKADLVVAPVSGTETIKTYGPGGSIVSETTHTISIGNKIEVLGSTNLQAIGGVLDKILIHIKDILNPLKFIKGLFTSFSDNNHDFDIIQVAEGGGINRLELTPLSRISVSTISAYPAIFGDIQWSFSADSSEFGPAQRLVETTFVGPSGTATFSQASIAVPEPSSLMVASLSALMAVAYSWYRQRRAAA